MCAIRLFLVFHLGYKHSFKIAEIFRPGTIKTSRIYQVTSPHCLEISTPLDLIGATAAAAAVMVKDSVSVLRFDGESE